MRRFDKPVVIGALLAGSAALAPGHDVAAQMALSGEPIRIVRLARPVTVDGRLEEGEWSGASRIDTWYETNPGDNTVPAVRNVGYIGYDDRFFYAAFQFDDPNPSAIRAPYSDRDRISGNATDYGGVILDTRNDGHSAVLLLTSPSGIQYDAITDDDGAGEDSSPDFFWESAARISERGWTLELRVPFSSLRYRDVNPQTWGIFLYRNYPRGFRYQYFSAPLPRGGNCFICRTNTLIGLENLPSGGHLVAAPYVSAGQAGRPSGSLGTALTNDPVDTDIGLDLKWTPDADNALDFTLKPDFSQVESDTAQISANERFALSFPEKRPFFLEGVELFSTPLRAVHTRAITSPRWGARATGKLQGVGYTVLVADDEGGGSVILPGPDGSTTAPQAFSSTVIVGRAKRGFGRNFVSLLATGREARDHGGSSWLIGPDVQWRPSTFDILSGQWVFSRTLTPNRPDLSPAWSGETVSGSAAHIQWSRNTRHLDASATYRDIGEGLRADAGFIPQVGYRETGGSVGWTIRPTGFVSRHRTFGSVSRQIDRTGGLISRMTNVGMGMDTRFNGFFQVRYHDDEIRSGSATFHTRRIGYVAQSSPSRWIPSIGVDGVLGEQVDFANSRLGRGGTVNLSARLNPTNHLELALLENIRWLDVDGDNARGRLFTARVSRARGTYTFTARSFLRVIAQYVSTTRDPALFLSTVAPRSGTFLGSLLLAYKLNWQSVVFVGYGDDRELSSEERLERSGRQVFVKLSYAIQR
jgi:hypothetical protein